MTVKNIFSLTPGECKVAEKLMSFEWVKGYDCHVTFPVKDVGIDLFIIRRIAGERERVVGLQVKESRDYSSRRKIRPYHSWYSISRNDFKKPFTRRPDFSRARYLEFRKLEFCGTSRTINEILAEITT